MSTTDIPCPLSVSPTTAATMANSDRTFNVYSQHKGSNIQLPVERSIENVRSLAEFSAKAHRDAFYRVFAQTGPNSEQFVVAFSVLDGVVREHADVTFPKAH